jgi:hypothetical protein
MAIENALEDAVNYLGTTVSSEREVSESDIGQGSDAETETDFSSATSTEAIQHIKHYEVTDHSVEEDDLMGMVHKATVKVTAGVPTEETQE